MAGFPPISVRQPVKFDLVDNPIEVSGVGTGFEGQLSARIRDADGNILAEQPVRAGGSGVWGNFQVQVAVPHPPPTLHGMLEVFEYSASNGDEINKQIVQIVFGVAMQSPYHGFAQYTVLRGDTLTGIAKDWYNDPTRYPIIFEANRDQLDDPDVIQAGQMLRIPQ